MIQTTLKNIDLQFETYGASFSPDHIDKGTLSMLSLIDFQPADKVLDLGCGYGVVGILAAKQIGPEQVVMCDINENNIALAQINAEYNGVPGIRTYVSDGFRSMNESEFTLILSNPPYHTDFSLPKHFIEKGFNRLVLGGKMVMVTKRKEWYKNKLTAIFGGVKISEIDGYFVFCAEKRSMQYARK